MNKPELLAPVGGKPHLIAAVNNGADAVYMGGMAFNARIFADNFSDEELPDAINYAHAHGVKVYMTINTLVNDGELARAFEYCNYIYGTGVDGVIIQDFGLARLLRKYLPDLPLHLSTQGTLYNTEAADTVSKLGFSRVVPARELSLAEITELAGHCRSLDKPVDVEVFVHGALCMCYSGQCQMSRVTGGGSGRTGNRGTCAQPCRHAYTDEKGNTYYALSPKDLCLIERIPDLVMSGASSFKIEGRMKSPEYVAIVTRIYRKYIDLFDRLVREHGEEAARDMYSVDEDDMLELRQIFNRGDFTEGYLFGNPGEDLLSGSSPKNQGLRIGRIQFFSFGGFPRLLLGPVKTIFRKFVQHFQIIGKAAGFVEVRNPGFDAGEFFQEGFRGFGISPKVRRQRLFRFGGHFLPFSGNIQTAVQGCHPFL